MEVFTYMKVFESLKNVRLIAGYDGNDEISLDEPTTSTSKCGIIEFDPNSKYSKIYKRRNHWKRRRI